MKDTILLVDDSPLIQKVGGQILSRKGFNVVLASNKQSALKQFSGDVCLVILGHNMPKLDGLEILIKIRYSTYKDEANVPVLILTSDEDPQEIKRLLDAGANDYLYKARLKSTPELYLEKVYSLLHYEKEAALCKKKKLARVLPRAIIDFYTFTNNFINNFNPSAFIQEYKPGEQPSLDEIREKLSKIYDLHEEGEINETFYEVLKPDAYLLTHTVNTTLLTVMFCSFLQMDREKVLDIAIGAFFHDIGNLEGEKPMLTNPCKLNDDEFYCYMTHVKNSLKATEDLHLPQDAIDFIENHHELINGNGFPAKKDIVMLSKVAQIANIIVTFDALTSEMGGERRMVAYDAIRKMQSWEGQFNEELLSKFSNFSRQFNFKPKD